MLLIRHTRSTHTVYFSMQTRFMNIRAHEHICYDANYFFSLLSLSVALVAPV